MPAHRRLSLAQRECNAEPVNNSHTFITLIKKKKKKTGKTTQIL